MAINTIIFDMDGVIADTERLHAEALSTVLANYGINLRPVELSHRFAGITGRTIFTDLFTEHAIEANVSAGLADWRSLMSKVEPEEIRPIDGILDLLGHLRSKGYDIGIASASRPEWISLVLQTLQLTDYFSKTTSVHEVSRCKPDPDIFLLAAQKLSAQPLQCLVIEDAVSGMTGAKRAGMYCIGYVDASRHRLDVDYPADHIVNHLSEITHDLIQSMASFNNSPPALGQNTKKQKE